jgi:hypothetical protein
VKPEALALATMLALAFLAVAIGIDDPAAGIGTAVLAVAAPVFLTLTHKE